MKKSPHESESPSRTQRIWPQQETPCIWMQAGIISFKLCNRNLECESCPFDMIMRSGLDRTSGEENPGGGAAVFAGTESDRSGIEPSLPAYDLKQVYFDPEAYYGAGFWYIVPVNDHVVEMGISEIGGKFLPSLKELVLPRQGTHIHANDTNFWLISSEGSIGLASPYAGLVDRVNTQVLRNLSSACRSTSSRLWFVELEVESSKQIVKGLVRGEKAADYLRSQHREILSTLEDALDRMPSETDRTMRDGGQYVCNFEELLGSKQYFQLMARHFRS